MITDLSEQKSIYISNLISLFQRWRKRYFVLHVPPASLPGSYHLDYYESAALKKKKGSIDLDLCEEILAKLSSPHYHHLFSLETKQGRRDRKYFLAADSEEEMNKWVECLCTACGCRPDAGIYPAFFIESLLPNFCYRSMVIATFSIIIIILLYYLCFCLYISAL